MLTQHKPAPSQFIGSIHGVAVLQVVCRGSKQQLVAETSLPIAGRLCNRTAVRLLAPLGKEVILVA